jgi:DNA adenine methylase
MKYMGSKNRHAKEILPIIVKGRTPEQWYVEPFVGGANVIDKVTGSRIGADIHPHLIAMWQAVSEGWVPPERVTEADYQNAKSRKFVDAYTGYVGFALSFGGKWFGGYRRDKVGIDRATNEEFQSAQSKRSAEKQFAKLHGVVFVLSAYDQLPIPPNSIIYCDPPYAGTTKYAAGRFDHVYFWQWCRDKVAEGHRVFVSEYNAPDDWVCVWEKPVCSSLTADTGAKRNVERLFVHTSQSKADGAI